MTLFSSVWLLLLLSLLLSLSFQDNNNEYMKMVNAFTMTPHRGSAATTPFIKRTSFCSSKGSNKRVFTENSRLFSTDIEGKGEEEEETTRKSWLSKLIDRSRGWLWPNSQPSESFTADVPTGNLGCPFVGNNIMQGNERQGPELFYRKQSKRLSDPPIWKSYFLGRPMVVAQGGPLVASLLNQEFNNISMSASYDDDDDNDDLTEEEKEKKYNSKPTLVGTNNVMFEPNRQKHQLLRRLIGMAMTPSQVAKTIPVLEQIATKHILENLINDTTTTANDILLTNNNNDNEMKSSKTRRWSFLQKKKKNSIPPGAVSMENVAFAFALQLVQDQLLGITFSSPEEAQRFESELQTWVKGIFNFASMFAGPFRRYLPAYKARQYIVSQVRKQIQTLRETGPDGFSTLSTLVFASVDDEDDKTTTTSKKKKKLSKKISLTETQVIENALVLIVAGTETSSSVLNLLGLCLALHPNALEKLQQEQERIIQTYGSHLSQDQLDSNTAPYLNAVVNEGLRLGAVTGGFVRKTDRDILVKIKNNDKSDDDEVQIPKGWSIFGSVRLTHQLDPKTYEPNDAHMDVHTGFRPERWLDPETAPKENFIPFGIGPRRCLGYNLAMAELLVFMSVLARNVDRIQLLTRTDRTTSGEYMGGIEWNPTSIVWKPADGTILRLFAKSKKNNNNEEEEQLQDNMVMPQEQQKQQQERI